MWFKITWPSGLVTHEASEAMSREALAMERWGKNTLEEVEAFGVKIEHAAHEELVSLGLVHADAPVADAAPAETPVPTLDTDAIVETVPTSPTPEPTESTQSAPETETKVYSDGSSATGPGPLPDQSPEQQR
jgi:hypothetical protein